MKYLIGLFFIFGTYTVTAQDTIREVVAQTRPLLIKTKTKAPESVKLKPKVVSEADKKSIKTDILNAFKTGKASLLAAYFPANIDINVLGKSNLYSKSQGEQVLSTFFTQNQPSGFSVIHEGKSNGTKYFIGTYTSNDIAFRVTVNVNTIKGVDKISSISIER